MMRRQIAVSESFFRMCATPRSGTPTSPAPPPPESSSTEEFDILLFRLLKQSASHTPRVTHTHASRESGGKNFS